MRRWVICLPFLWCGHDKKMNWVKMSFFLLSTFSNTFESHLITYKSYIVSSSPTSTLPIPDFNPAKERKAETQPGGAEHLMYLLVSIRCSFLLNCTWMDCEPLGSVPTILVILHVQDYDRLIRSSCRSKLYRIEKYYIFLNFLIFLVRLLCTRHCNNLKCIILALRDSMQHNWHECEVPHLPYSSFTLFYIVSDS